MADQDFESYEPVIGLEIHCQLNTRSKLFCGCPTSFGATPNANVCPVCLGYPGVLPVLNEQAVRKAVVFGSAVSGDIRNSSEFSRKQYFYPDLPKGYQITQYEFPYCVGGFIDLPCGRQIPLTRIHMEEDAGKNIHSGAATLVDLNRAGVPLIEIVSEPVIKSPQEAASVFKAVRDLARYLDVSDANMEEGCIRCDANVSIRRRGAVKLGTRTEIKNLNSFKNIERAVSYEILRQIDILESGSSIVSQTVHFDAASGKTSPMRTKEQNHDYRYFPEPDLPRLVISETLLEDISIIIPELPKSRYLRLISDYSLTQEDAEILMSEKSLVDFFEAIVSLLEDQVAPKIAANWLLSEYLRVCNNNNYVIGNVDVFSPNQVADLLNLIGSGVISGKIGKEVFEKTLGTTESPREFVKRTGLQQIVDPDEIKRVVTEVLCGNDNLIQQYLDGKTKLLGFFVGKIMQRSQGKFSPELVNSTLLKELQSFANRSRKN